MNKIFCVGLSNKEGKLPLDSTTNSGKIIDKLETKLNHNIYRINLVDFAPLDNNGKLRYPNKKEMNEGALKLIEKINIYKPKYVILLGSKVSDEMEKHLNIKLSPNSFKDSNFNYYGHEVDGVIYIKVQHPSYINVFKRKFIDNYINGIITEINK